MKGECLLRSIANASGHRFVTKIADESKTILPLRLQHKSKFSTNSALLTVWPSDWVEPVPEKQFYYDNPPVEGEAMSLTHVIAAPTRHYYSVFHDPKLEKFEKMILKQGKGSIAYQLLRDTLRNIKAVQVKKYHMAPDDVKPSIEVNPLVIFHQAIENGTPVVGVKSVKKGGATFKVPCPLPEKKKFFMVSRWFLEQCRSGKPNTPLSQRLTRELLAAYGNQGSIVKKKLDLHRDAEMNRAFANLFWK